MSAVANSELMRRSKVTYSITSVILKALAVFRLIAIMVLAVGSALLLSSLPNYCAVVPTTLQARPGRRGPLGACGSSRQESFVLVR